MVEHHSAGVNYDYTFIAIRAKKFVFSALILLKMLTKSFASLSLALLFAVVYFTSWSALSSPFVPFPGDDVFVANKIASVVGLMDDRSSMLDSPNPVYYMLVYATIKLCGMLGHLNTCDAGEAILHLAIASNAVILLLIGLIVFQLTKNLYIQSISHVIYAFAAWPITYHFMVSYTVTTSALVLLVLYLILVSNRAAHLLPAGAGIATALALWTSPAGPLTVGLLVMTVTYLLWNGNTWSDLYRPSCYDKRRLGIFMVSFMTVSTVFGYGGFQHLLSHLHHNINTSHYTDVYQRFGFVPESPLLFSYLYILKEYGHVGLVLFIGTLTALPFLAVRSVGDTVNRQTILVLMILTVFVILHAVLIDLLPTTKLARTHFPAYPVSLIIICATGSVAYARLIRLRNARILSTVFACVALIALSYEGARLGTETRHVKTAAGQYLNNTRETTDWYLLQEDPHQGQMWLTFNWSLLDIKSIHVSMPGFHGLHGMYKPDDGRHPIQLIPASRVTSLLAMSKRNSIGIILGPHGHGSGLSVAGHATFPDFYPAEFLNLNALQPRIKEIISFPYYMHYPPFLMEEETSAALYFGDAIPDYRIPRMGITVIRL